MRSIYFVKTLPLLLFLGTAVFFVHRSKHGNCHDNRKSNDGPLQRFVLQTLQSSSYGDRMKLSEWWKFLSRSYPTSYLKQPKQHRALGPAQKAIGNLAASSEPSSNRDFFGPTADWSCTTKGAVDYVSCVETPDHTQRTECSWCPMGGEFGLCVHQTQAVTINSMESWHLKCDPPGPIEDEAGIAFWAEAMECSKFNLQDCLNGEDGKEKCTWCESTSSYENEPSFQFCASQTLWDELKGKQHSDAEGHINVDQVFSCRSESRDANEKLTSLFDTTCAREGAGYSELQSEEENKKCTDTLDNDDKNCTIAQNPFPGLFMGSTAGSHCVSESQYEVLRWIVGVMKDMGWESEGNGQDG